MRKLIKNLLIKKTLNLIITKNKLIDKINTKEK